MRAWNLTALSGQVITSTLAIEQGCDTTAVRWHTPLRSATCKGGSSDSASPTRGVRSRGAIVAREGRALLRLSLSYLGKNSNSALSFLAERTRWAANLSPRLETKFSIKGDWPWVSNSFTSSGVISSSCPGPRPEDPRRISDLAAQAQNRAWTD